MFYRIDILTKHVKQCDKPENGADLRDRKSQQNPETNKKNDNLKCDFCNDHIFSTAEFLIAHTINVHRLYPCALCDQICGSLLEIRNHYKWGPHEKTGKGGYPCEICGLFFIQTGIRRAHQRKAHNYNHEKAIYRCFSCNSVFDTQDRLFQHASQTSHLIEAISDIQGFTLFFYIETGCYL